MDTYHLIKNEYASQVQQELYHWQKQMLRNPSLLNKFSKIVQTKINSWIPEKLHNAITIAIKQMIRGVLFGAKFLSAEPAIFSNLQDGEMAVKRKIDSYVKTAAVEGGVTGAGGILLGLADFPILIGLKLKMLFDIGCLYGFDVNNYTERLYILHIFELAFSSHEHRKRVYLIMINWDEELKNLPEDINSFDWRNFQQEYRDYIDLAKMAQLVPVIGAPVGLVVNYRLMKKLGNTAMNAYRMRLLDKNNKDKASFFV